MMLKKVKMPMAAGGGTSNRRSIRSALKRGFTIMELVIVIAVIAVLAAVLIPTFANIIQRANESNDISLARNMNTLLATEQVGGESPSSMEDVMFILDQNGYGLDNLNPTADGNMFIWNSEDNRLVYVDSDGNVLYSENGKYTTIVDLSATSYLTVSNEEEIDKWVDLATNGIGIYLENDITLAENKTFNTPVSIDAGVSTLNGTVTFAGVSGTVEFDGTLDSVVINSPNAEVYNYSNVTNMTIGAVASSSYHEYGYVENLTVSATNASNVVIESTGMVVNLTNSSSTATVTNRGYVETITSGSNAITSENGYVGEDNGVSVEGTPAASYTYEINNYADLASFRDKVNAGNEFEDLTVSLEADINLTGRAWVPIANYYRDYLGSDDEVAFAFKGTFEGNNHTITGLSSSGFSLENMAVGINGTTPTGYNEYSYGFFGLVQDAIIKDLNLANVNINLPLANDCYADSVGAIVGFAAGFTMDNCTVSGTINGSGDAISGLVGRCYNGSVTISNCTNNADVTGGGRASGIVGYFDKLDAESTITFNSNTNNGDITCTGEYGTAGYHVASGISATNNNESKIISDGNNVNNGEIVNNDSENSSVVANIFSISFGDSHKKVDTDMEKSSGSTFSS